MKKHQYLVLNGILMTGLLTTGPAFAADDTAQLKEQVRALQERVVQLESQADQKHRHPQIHQVAPFYDQWSDPFAQMMLMHDQMERNMRQALDDAGMMYSPEMDIKQTDKQYFITLDLPGMEKDKIDVQIKEGMLIVSGERRSEKKDNKNNQFYRQERSFGSFMQAIPLPKDAQTDKIDANYKNGVLTVIIDRLKKEEKKSGPHKIMVK